MEMFLKILLILVIFGVVVYGTSYLLRKMLGIEQPKFFGADYVNEKHRLIEQKARIAAVALIVIGYFINLMCGLDNVLWYFEPMNILFLSVIVNYIIKAVMEKRYKENNKYFIVSLVELIIMTIFFITAIQTNFYGLF